MALSPELWGVWRSRSWGSTWPHPNCTCFYHSLPLPLGAGPPLLHFQGVWCLASAQTTCWANGDLGLSSPVGSSHASQAQSLRVTQDTQEVPLSAPSDSAQNLPIAHYLHIHQPGLSRHHLLSRPKQWPPPHGLPCFCSHTPQPIHIWLPSHIRSLCSDTSMALLGVKTTVHIIANKVPWHLCSHCLPDQSPATLVSLLWLGNIYCAPGPLNVQFTLPGSSSFRDSRGVSIASFISLLTCHPLNEAFPGLLINLPPQV